ncbi:molybdopterin molybdotransferase MoeA [Corynebacterium pseudodiphtheriticum]|uniref:molybdopterin molybdotransferase MoeA n=1 Tax=Corynebacterium pseudodiphtheriticum TaxID=37637 RepID=UPI0020BEC856|nr:molybdopterin molybdotransferase MoeA [Corynebacterium pseudodiphtheriticum]UQV56961.1 molybdopterin molybdotransferase MoeA [Corynebacterium pseudodiphtheriticum]
MITSSVSVAEHLKRVRELVQPTKPQRLSVEEAHGCYLAQTVQARVAIPSFHNSAMDGFLVHDKDLSGSGPWTLPVSGEVAAGGLPQEVVPNQALRIMTGAPISGDANSLRVIPSEFTDASLGPAQLPTQVTIHEAPKKRHIRLRGEVVTPGEDIAHPNTLIDAGTLAFFLTAGVSHVSVYRRPQVAVISSGDELVSTANVGAAATNNVSNAAGVATGVGTADENAVYRIADSNGPMVANLLAEHGPVDVRRFHVGDGTDNLTALLDELTSSSAQPVDLIVTTGGISQGAFDVVKAAAIDSPNADFWFGNAAQRPGSPQGAGLWNGTAVVTLPGNPVAAYVSATVYVLACLYILQGRVTSTPAEARSTTKWWPHCAALVHAHPTLPLPRPGKTQLVPVQVVPADTGLLAVPNTGGNPGSHFVSALIGIDGLAVIPPAEDAEHPDSPGMATVLGWSR